MSSMTRRAGLGRLEAVLIFAVLAGGWLFVGVAGVALLKARETGSKTKCSNSLRQLGLAAIQYADDKRYFPHVGPLKEHDGGVDTNASTKTVRALMWYGYHDNPEGFVCPQSYDSYAPIADDEVKASVRQWFWGGQRVDPVGSPFVDGLPDPVLDDTDELSFGWTRRGMTSNVRSTSLLAGDRAQADPDSTAETKPGLVGNHGEGANLLQADGTVHWVDAQQDGVASLADLSAGGAAGFLAIRPPVRSPWARGEPFSRARASAWLPLLGLFGPPVLLGLLLTALVRRSPREVPDKLVVAPSSAPRGPSRVTPLGSESVVQHQQRCPLCHDAVRVEDPLSRCLDCLAVFHAECVAPGAACPTLGCGVRA